MQPLGRLIPPDIRITYPPDPPESLRRSIREAGILSPLLCFEDGEAFRILDGNRRYLIARDLKMDSVPVAVLTEASPREKALAWLQAQRAVRSLNVFEIAALLGNSESWLGLPAHDMRRIIASDPPFPVSPDMLEDFPHLLTLPEQLKRVAVRRAYSPPFLLRIVRLYPRELIETIGRVLEFFEFSENQLDSLVEWMDDVSKRDGISSSDLLKKDSVAFVLSHPKMPVPKKRDAFLKAVWRLRFPYRSQLEETIQGIQRKVASVGDARLVVPRDLMGDRYELRIGFRESEELQTLLERVSRLMATLGKEIERL